MVWDASSKPRLRPLEAFRVPAESDGEVGIRDPSHLSDVAVTLSHAALQIVSLMDGTNTCDDIRQKYLTTFGQPLSTQTLQTMLEHLEQAHFLEGSSFDLYYQSLRDEYLRQEARKMRDAEAYGITDQSGKLFNEMLDQSEQTTAPGPVVGLVAPHLDYPRGAPCYGKAYGTLRSRAAPKSVVILGTNHFGRSSCVVATASDFATPLGTSRNDVAFLEELERRCGGLRTYELDHAREHSIELQVLWLQLLFGAATFTMVPILCPDPCGPTGTAPYDGQGVSLADFAVALGELIREDPSDTLIGAGADLSHVGAAFGGERRLDDDYLGEVRDHDHRVLELYAADDPEAFRQCVAADGNPTSICSAGCMFALATALPHATATILGYHQAVDVPSQTCVTCAAVVFTSPVP